ncbi:MAG: hypothetical protein JWR83_244 [Aeromicrobium sp.]|nr:hypothetical protein [Aeromicrobium sp.]
MHKAGLVDWHSAAEVTHVDYDAHHHVDALYLDPRVEDTPERSTSRRKVADMTDDATPLAYTALEIGTPVQASDGHEFGTVGAVLVVEEVDVFDGIVVITTEGPRFVDADSVGQLTTSYVRTTLSQEDAGKLPQPDDSPVYRVDATDDAGTSLADRFGRMFGRGKWNRE